MDTQVQHSHSQDPRRLRVLMERAEALARQHGLRSVIVGLAGFEGDPSFPSIVEYLESALRVDDSVFRMTRERVVLLLADVDAAGATTILARLLEEYRESFPSNNEPVVGIGTFEVGPETPEITVKSVLPRLFSTPPQSH